MKNPLVRSSIGKNWELSSMIRNKAGISSLTTVMKHNTGSNQKTKRNKRHPSHQGRSKTFNICRWHDTLYRNSKTPPKNCYYWYTNSVKSQDTKSMYRNLLPYYTRIINSRKRNQWIHPIYNCTKNHKNKPNQRGKICVLWKL